MYELLDIPPFDTSSIIEPFTRLVLEKEILRSLDKNNAIQNYTTYVIADGALDKEVDVNLEVYRPKYRTLYPEHYEKAAGYAQPFLVDLESSTEFKEWFLEKGYGNGRGIYIITTQNIDTLAENIKGFTLGHMKEGNKETFFRFYDPKIFPAFLRMLAANQLVQLFGGESFYMCENFIDRKQMDIYTYDPIKQHTLKASHTLWVAYSPLLANAFTPYESLKMPVFYQAVQERLVFDTQDVNILSQHKLYIHAKQVAHSLIEQYPPYKDKTLNTLYKPILDLTQQGYALGLHDPETNFLWVVANVWHEGVEKLKEHQTYGKIFDISGVVTQGQKSMLLEALVDELEEKLRKKEEKENA